MSADDWQLDDHFSEATGFVTSLVIFELFQRCCGFRPHCRVIGRFQIINHITATAKSADGYRQQPMPCSSGPAEQVAMTNTERNKFRVALEAGLTAIGDGGANREALAIDTSPDEMDRIQHASERDYAVSSLERDASRLRELRAALVRLEAGTFGICVGCEEPISPKRLAAIPWAAFCIVCQEAADRERKAAPDDIDPSMVIAA